MDSGKGSQQKVPSTNDQSHLETVLPLACVDGTSETQVQSSNGQEVVNQAVAAVVASVVSRNSLLTSAYHISIVL